MVSIDSQKEISWKFILKIQFTYTILHRTYETSILYAVLFISRKIMNLLNSIKLELLNNPYTELAFQHHLYTYKDYNFR